MTPCPKTTTIHRDDQCVWCGRDDLYPYGVVPSQGRQCPDCGAMVWLCNNCYNGLLWEYTHRKPAQTDD